MASSRLFQGLASIEASAVVFREVVGQAGEAESRVARAMAADQVLVGPGLAHAKRHGELHKNKTAGAGHGKREATAGMGRRFVCGVRLQEAGFSTSTN